MTFTGSAGKFNLMVQSVVIDAAVIPRQIYWALDLTPWSQKAWGCRSSPPPRSWSGLRETRCRPAWSCLGWPPCCRTPCCTCSWVSSPWCAALGREAWETSGAGLLNLAGERDERRSDYDRLYYNVFEEEHVQRGVRRVLLQQSIAIMIEFTPLNVLTITNSIIFCL